MPVSEVYGCYRDMLAFLLMSPVQEKPDLHPSCTASLSWVTRARQEIEGSGCHLSDLCRTTTGMGSCGPSCHAVRLRLEHVLGFFALLAGLTRRESQPGCALAWLGRCISVTLVTCVVSTPHLTLMAREVMPGTESC